MGREDPKVSHVCEGWRAIDVMDQDRKPEREVGWGTGKIRGSVGDMLHLKHCRTDRNLESSWKRSLSL